jgi:hypothetical protein
MVYVLEESQVTLEVMFPDMMMLGFPAKALLNPMASMQRNTALSKILVLIKLKGFVCANICPHFNHNRFAPLTIYYEMVNIHKQLVCA